MTQEQKTENNIEFEADTWSKLYVESQRENIYVAYIRGAKRGYELAMEWQIKWKRATEETIPKSSGFPIMLIVKWFEGEGDDERTLVRHMTNNQLLDKVKGTWDYHYFLDETSPTPEPGKEFRPMGIGNPVEPNNAIELINKIRPHLDPTSWNAQIRAIHKICTDYLMYHETEYLNSKK